MAVHFAPDDAIAFKLAQLLGQHLAAGARNEAAELARAARSVGQVMEDDRLPFSAYDFKRSSNWALKQQREEARASQEFGFAPDIETEMRKVEACDLLIFSFPLWWFGMPAILKGWVDRVFAYGRFYGAGKWYENGTSQGKRAMALITTGGGESMYGESGPHPSLESVLAPIHHGIFWFNGFSVLEPFVAWSAAHGTDEDRREILDTVEIRLRSVFEESPLRFPKASALN